MTRHKETAPLTRFIVTVEIPVRAVDEEEAGDLVMDELDELPWTGVFGEPFSTEIREEE